MDGGEERRKVLRRNGVRGRLLSWIPTVQAVLPATGPDDLRASDAEPSGGVRPGAAKFLMEETPDGSPSLASLDGCNLCFEAEADGPEEVSAGADAGAAVPLQSGVRRLRQDSVSRAHPEGAASARRLLQGGRRVRNPDGCDPRRRTAAASADAAAVRRRG